MPALPRPRLRTAAATLAVTAIAVVGLAAPASAHVTVGADDAQQGATDSVLTFRVPNEEAAAITVKVSIAFPTRTPLPSVDPAPKPGWVLTTTKTTFNPPITTDDGTITDGVTQVVYTASAPADGVPVGDFDTFQVLVGPLPTKVTSLAFPTVQTYSDGKTVSWIEPVTDPANEPDFPTPVLRLVGAPAAGASASGSGSAPAVVGVVGVATVQSPTTADVTTAHNLAVVGIVLGVLGLLAGLAGLLGVLRSRRVDG
jgi:periplasmic copper chaperone A